jgi:hypothetical protein
VYQDVWCRVQTWKIRGNKNIPKWWCHSSVSIMISNTLLDVIQRWKFVSFCPTINIRRILCHRLVHIIQTHAGLVRKEMLCIYRTIDDDWCHIIDLWNISCIHKYLVFINTCTRCKKNFWFFNLHVIKLELILSFFLKLYNCLSRIYIVV